MKNRCPWPECNKEVEYNGTTVVGIEDNGRVLAVHRGCFTNIGLFKGFFGNEEYERIKNERRR